MMDRKMVNFIKEQYPPGTRIRLNAIPVTSIICIANDGVIIKGRSNCKIPIVKADLLQDFIEEYQTPVNLSKEEIEATLHTIDSYKVSEQLVLEEPKFIAPPQ